MPRGGAAVSTKLKPKYRDFFEAVADTEGPSFVILHPIYGKIASVAVDHIIKRLPSVPVPSGAKQGCLGASVPPVLRRAAERRQGVGGLRRGRF